MEGLIGAVVGMQDSREHGRSHWRVEAEPIVMTLRLRLGPEAESRSLRDVVIQA
jgi:hypothetical protein